MRSHAREIHIFRVNEWSRSENRFGKARGRRVETPQVTPMIGLTKKTEKI